MIANQVPNVGWDSKEIVTNHLPWVSFPVHPSTGGGVFLGLSSSAMLYLENIQIFQ